MSATPVTGTIYDLEGTLLEACSCGVLCRCWVGADPDGGICSSFNTGRVTHSVAVASGRR